MERSGVCGFAGNVRALFCVEGLCNAVKVKAFLAELLEKVGHKNRLRNASGAMKPVYLPLLSVRAVNSEVPCYANCHGKTSKVGSPATPAFRDHWVGWIVRCSWWPCRVLESQCWSVGFQES